MNFQTAKAELRKFFAEGWDDETPVIYDDVSDTPPSDEPWVRFTLKHNIGYQASIGAPGSNRFRREGLIFVSVFDKQGNAGLRADELADIAADIFISSDRQDFKFYDVTIREVGPDGFGWFQINVVVSFQYDHIT